MGAYVALTVNLILEILTIKNIVFLGTVLEITMSPVKTSTEENSNNFHNLKPTSMLRECQLQILLTEPASESKPNPTPSRSDPNSLS